MSSQKHTPDIIAEAEKLVSRIKDVSSCRIATSPIGEITEIHVVATGHKPAKLVARDVESCLKAELDIEVDHRKIGVVMFDPDDEGMITPHENRNSQPEPVMELPIEEHPSRFTFQSVNLFMSQESIQAEVELIRDGVETFGSAKTENLASSPSHVIGEATLNAVGELLDESTRLCLSEVQEILLGKELAVVVKVSLIKHRETKSLAGCSLYSGNVNQTVVFATLDAINRVLGKLSTKSSIEYKIK